MRSIHPFNKLDSSRLSSPGSLRYNTGEGEDGEVFVEFTEQVQFLGFRITEFHVQLREFDEQAKSGWSVYPEVGRVEEEESQRRATLTLKMSFHEFRKEKVPFEINLEARGVFVTRELPAADFLRFVRVKGAVGLVPRVRAVVKEFLEKAGIAGKIL